MFGEDAAILSDADFRILLSAAILPVLGVSLVSPVLDSLVDPLGASSSTIGLVMSAFTAPGVAMIPVAGALADRYGRKPVLAGSLLLYGVGGVAIAFTTDFRVVLGLRFLQGVAFAGINPILITSVGDLYTGSKEATGQGLRFTVSGLSGAVIPFVAGVLVVFAWQYPFLLYGIAIPIAGVVLVWFEEPTTTVDGDVGASASYLRELFELVSQPRALVVLMARAIPSAVWIGFLTYNSIIVVRVIGGTPPQAGLLVAVGSLAFATAASQAGRITRWFATRYWPLVGANVCLGGGYLVVLVTGSVGVAALGITVTGVGFGILLSLYRSIVTELAPEELRAGLVSLAEAGGQLSNTVTPIAMGAIVALAQPAVGFAAAVQLAGVAAVIVGAGGGLVCVLVVGTDTDNA